jgi:ADP-ribose pyrophosphatase YjhB (NUDIX family)
MSHHEPEFQFCPVCGGRLTASNLKDNEPSRSICSACDFVFYLDPKVVACSVVEMEDKIVLLKRGIEPQKGKWVMPGGYVDRGEAVNAAAIRETEEECGLKSRIRKLLGVYSYSGDVPVVIVYVTGYLSGDLIAGDETLEAKLFLEAEIPWEKLAFRSTMDALKDYYLLKKGNKVNNLAL